MEIQAEGDLTIVDANGQKVEVTPQHLQNLLFYEIVDYETFKNKVLCPDPSQKILSFSPREGQTYQTPSNQIFEKMFQGSFSTKVDLPVQFLHHMYFTAPTANPLDYGLKALEFSELENNAGKSILAIEKYNQGEYWFLSKILNPKQISCSPVTPLLSNITPKSVTKPPFKSSTTKPVSKPDSKPDSKPVIVKVKRRTQGGSKKKRRQTRRKRRTRRIRRN